MDINIFIQNLWLFLSFLTIIISVILVFKNGRKSGMFRIYISAIGLIISGVFLTLSLFWNTQTDILTILFGFGVFLIFVIVYVLVSKVNMMIFQEFDPFKQGTSSNSLMRKQKKRCSNINDVKDKKDADSR